MKNYIVSARKYRPITFKSVVGQTALTNTLKNAIKTNHLAHAYLFCGTRGVGKTTCARIFAKTINCEHLTEDYEACNECESCVAFNEQRSYNIHELDAASNNSVDDIRSLIEQVRIPPQIGKYSVYIIDEVHMLSTSAFNAFLKILEEPPAHVIFILATTEKHKIIPTILSRCQIYDFNRISVHEIVEQLQYIAQQENITADINALNVIAQKSDGSMRDALSIFDQMVSLCENNITYQQVLENLNILDYEYYFQLVNAFLKGDISQSLLIFNEILNKGFDAYHFITGLSSHLRDILVCKDPQTIPLLEVGADIGKHYQTQAESCSSDFLFNALKIITSECELNYNISKNKRLLIELTLIRLCQLTKESQPIIEEKIPLQKIIPNDNAINSKNYQKDEIQIHNEKMNSRNSVKETNNVSVKEPKQKYIQPPVSISINSSNTTSEEISEKKVTPEIIQNENFTDENLVKAWKDFAETLSEEEIRMKTFIQNTEPQRLSETDFEVSVANTLQEKELKKLQPQILSYLQNQLKNSTIQMKIKLMKKTESQKPKNPEERYKTMAEQNPAITVLKNGLQLEIN